MNLIHKAKWGYILSSAMVTILGLCLVIWPTLLATAMCYIVGILLILLGIIKITGYFARDSYGLAFQFDFALGLFAAVVGCIFLFRPKNILVLFPIILGLYILIDGVFKLQTALDAKRFGLREWRIIFIAPILTGILGLLLLTDPFSSAAALTVLLGIALASDGVQNFFVAVYAIS